MKKFLFLFVLIVGLVFKLNAQVATLECLSCQTKTTQNCVNCTFEQTSELLNGIKVYIKGKAPIMLTNPVKSQIVGNVLTLKDAYDVTISTPLNKITTYNTSAKILDFLRSCSCETPETITTISGTQPAGKVIGTYTNELGNQFQIRETITNISGIQPNGNPIGTYTNENGNSTVIRESNISVVDNGNGTVTITNESGTAVTFNIGDVNTTLTNIQATGKIIGTYTNELGNAVNIRESLSTLVNNGGGSFTFTNENGSTTNFTIPTITVVSEDANNSITVGTDAGAFLNVGKPNTWIIGTAAYDSGNPLAGWSAPSNPIAGNTVEVKFNDGTIGNYTFDGVNWVMNYTNEWFEERICLNTATPTFTPADLNNPLVSEVDAWATANLTIKQRQNGTKLVYYVVGDGGSCDVPDYEWTLNKGSQLVTLSNKRVFNTKTVYVDAGSGSDITGRRGYREFPFKTLDAAIPLLQNGDLLKVFPGDYSSSVSTNKIFHIDCDNGVNWRLINAFTTAATVSTPTTVNWSFDRLYTTVTNISTTVSPNLMNAVNFGVNLTIRNAEYILAISNGSLKNFVSQYWNIDNSYNSHFTPSTLFNQYPLPISSIKFNNIYKDTDVWNVGCQLSENSTYYIDLNAAQWKSTGNLQAHFFGRFFSSDQNTHNKTIYFNCKSLRTYKDIQLNSYPIFTDPITAETNGTGNGSNTILRVRNMSNNDIVTFNIEGTFNTHVADVDFHASNRSNSIYTYNIKGRQYKGITIYTGQGSAASNNEVHINLDVQSDDHAAVYIGLDGSILSPNATIVVTGRIKVTRAGFPCIVLGNNQNNRVVLKDLILINDGTVSPIMINSSTPENVTIQNVTSNSLISDPNIIETGQSIIRNSNYK